MGFLSYVQGWEWFCQHHEDHGGSVAEEHDGAGRGCLTRFQVVVLGLFSMLCSPFFFLIWFVFLCDFNLNAYALLSTLPPWVLIETLVQPGFYVLWANQPGALALALCLLIYSPFFSNKKNTLLFSFLLSNDHFFFSFSWGNFNLEGKGLRVSSSLSFNFIFPFFICLKKFLSLILWGMHISKHMIHKIQSCVF